MQQIFIFMLFMLAVFVGITAACSILNAEQLDMLVNRCKNNEGTSLVINKFLRTEISCKDGATFSVKR